MSCIRVAAFIGLAAAALTVSNAGIAGAQDYDYGQEAKRVCEQAGLGYTESIYLPGGLPASATCHEHGKDEVKWVPFPQGTPCSEPGVLSAREGSADGAGNCVIS